MPFISLFCYNIIASISYVILPLCCSPYTYLSVPLLMCGLGSFTCCLPLTACFSVIPCVSPVLFFCSMLPTNLLWWCMICTYNPIMALGASCFSLTCFPCIPCSVVPVMFAQLNVLCIGLCNFSLIGTSMIGQVCVCATSCIPCGSCLPITGFTCLYPCSFCFSSMSQLIPAISQIPCICMETVMIPTHLIGACCECMCPPLSCMNCACMMPMSLCASPCTVASCCAVEGLTVTTICSPCLATAPCLCACPPLACPACALSVPCGIGTAGAGLCGIGTVGAGWYGTLCCGSLLYSVGGSLSTLFAGCAMTSSYFGSFIPLCSACSFAGSGATGTAIPAVTSGCVGCPSCMCLSPVCQPLGLAVGTVSSIGLCCASPMGCISSIMCCPCALSLSCIPCGTCLPTMCSGSGLSSCIMLPTVACPALPCCASSPLCALPCCAFTCLSSSCCGAGGIVPFVLPETAIDQCQSAMNQIVPMCSQGIFATSGGMASLGGILEGICAPLKILFSPLKMLWV